MPDLHDDAEVDPDDILVFGVPLQPGLKHRASMGTILTSPTTQSLTSSEDEEEEEEEEDDGAYHDHVSEQLEPTFNTHTDTATDICLHL